MPEQPSPSSSSDVPVAGASASAPGGAGAPASSHAADSSPQARTSSQAGTRWQIRFGGMGGQGVVVLGDTIALAGALAGWHAAGSTSYGAQARGGASKADVVLSRDPIDYPHVERPDVMVLVSQEAYDVYTAAAPDTPLVLVDGFVVTPRDLGGAARQVSVNATQIALDDLGNRQGSNFVVLGAFLALTGALTLEEVDAAIEAKMAKRWWDLNQRALRLGFEAA